MKINKSGVLKYSIFSILAVAICGSCKSQTVIAEKAKLIVKEEAQEDAKLYKEFKAYGKKAIPYLIDVIDTEKKGFMGYNDPESSAAYAHHNCVGIRAAYMIEYILSGSSKDQIYENGLIVKKSNIYLDLTFADMKEVKKIYEKWWQKNKNKPLTSLTKSWKAGNSILKNSDYRWQ